MDPNPQVCPAPPLPFNSSVSQLGAAASNRRQELCLLFVSPGQLTRYTSSKSLRCEPSRFRLSGAPPCLLHAGRMPPQAHL